MNDKEIDTQILLYKNAKARSEILSLRWNEMRSNT